MNQPMNVVAALEPLHIADPDFAAWVAQKLSSQPIPPSVSVLGELADASIWALTLDRTLAQLVAGAMIDMIARGVPNQIGTYIFHVRRAAVTGITLARIVATHLGPVLTAPVPLLDKFLDLLTIMQGKGTYTLNQPLELLTDLIRANDTAGSENYIDLLAAIFAGPLSFNHSQRLVYQIPKGIRQFPRTRRAFQIRQMQRVVRCHVDLISPYLEGMQNGLERLSEQALSVFIDQALLRYEQAPLSGANFLSLKAVAARDRCDALQITASLDHVRGQLERYLRARLNRSLTIKPLDESASAHEPTETFIYSDGRTIFLAEEIGYHDRISLNNDLYLNLVRLEACFFECRSFNFDHERAARFFPIAQQRPTRQPGQNRCEAQDFFSAFSNPQLAEDLFMILDLGRLFKFLEMQYPGLIRRVRPLLEGEIHRLAASGQWEHPLSTAYQKMVFKSIVQPSSNPLQDQIAHHLEALTINHLHGRSPVEAIAPLVCLEYERIVASTDIVSAAYRPFHSPFGQRLRWDRIAAALKPYDQKAEKIKRRLAEKEITIYKADLQQALLNNQGRLTASELRTMLTADRDVERGDPHSVTVPDLEELKNLLETAPGETNCGPDTTYCYPEWDNLDQGYLQDHVRVREITPESSAGTLFYQETTMRRRGLVAHMRRAFEWLKPKGQALLRQWPEGDAFDYRALLDFMVDRRMGRIPSERLYIKRLKQERDVAVLLLTDLSRSTANPVFGRPDSVLDLTKEALVLFCEALVVVGDRFALAGFSSSGRHHVDYIVIKDFIDPLDDVVKQHIGALRPLRSTRMGAAIRHATYRLTRIAARVRLLLIISDGFPNDLGYKADYAIADTRKAVQEAQSRGLFVKALTINIGRDPKLDDLYGRSHSHVIDDVGELPGKLLRLYSTLTRPA